MTVLIVDLSSLIHSFIACGFVYSNIIFLGEHMFVTAIFFFHNTFFIEA